MRFSVNEDEIHINTEGVEVTPIYVNGIEYLPQPRNIKFFRAIQDRDKDYWIEVEPNTSGAHWRLMRFNSSDPNHYDTVGDVIEVHGPLTTG